MGLLQNLLPWILGGLFGALVLFALRVPLKWLGRLAARTGVGLAVLAIFGHLSTFLGVSLGVNLANALVLGVLGVPGFGLLLMLHWAFTIC